MRPAQLVRDAREHGIEVLPVDVLASDWESTLEERTTAAASVSDGVDYRPQPAVRLGLDRIHGLGEAAGAPDPREPRRRRRPVTAAGAHGPGRAWRSLRCARS